MCECNLSSFNSGFVISVTLQNVRGFDCSCIHAAMVCTSVFHSDFYISLLLLFFTFSFFFVTKTDEKYDDIFCKSVSAPIANLYLTQFKIAACRYIIWYYFPPFFFFLLPHSTRFNMEAHFLFVILLMQLNASNDMDFFFCQYTFWKNVHSSMQIF